MFKKIIEAVLVEEKLNDPRATRQRIKICESGVCKKFNSKKRKCRGCGCYVDIKAKMKVHKNPLKNMREEITHCPLALWPGDEKKIVNHYRSLDNKDLLL